MSFNFLDQNLWLEHSLNIDCRLPVNEFFIYNLKIIVPENQRYGKLYHFLSKCLAQTDPLPAQKGRESHGVAVTAIRPFV